MSSVKLSSLALHTSGFLSHQDQEKQDFLRRLYLSGNLKCDFFNQVFLGDVAGEISEARRKPWPVHGCVKTCRMEGQLRVQPLELDGTGA